MPKRKSANSTARARRPARSQSAVSAAAPSRAKKRGAAAAHSKPDLPKLIAALKAAYPEALCALRHDSPFQLAVATILSAQCTDARVNMVTPALFHKYPDPAALAAADPAAVSALIRSTGFFNNKTKSLIGFAQALMRDHGGQVPDTMEALNPLPGIGRKTANVVLGTAFGIAVGVVVDTHVKRISHHLGLTDATDPEKIEKDLMAQLPREEWIGFSHRIILHGRAICEARKPRCAECPLQAHCRYYRTEVATRE